MRRVLLLTVALGGCAHHPLSCAIGLPYEDCLPGTSGAEHYSNGGRVTEADEWMLLNHAAAVQAAGYAGTMHALDSYMHTLTPPVVVYSPPVTYYAPR